MESDSDSNIDNDEQYNPEEPIYYDLKAKDCLRLDLPIDSMVYDNIYISAYTINIDGEYPFQRYLLTNNTIYPNLMFPRIPLFSNLNTPDLINYAKVCLFGLLMMEEFDLFNSAIKFTGFFESNHNLYMFFDISKLILRIDDIYKSNHLWLTLMDEIVNQKNICGINIDDSVVNLFLANEKFCFLVDENGETFEIPFVCYTAKPASKLNFTFIFGEPKSDKNSILGPFYYFTDFKHALKDAGFSENMEGGIVRFAVFPGNTKYIENHPDDPIDESVTKHERFSYNNIDHVMEVLTARISDHDGNWSRDYDSAYLGCLELDNGIFLEKPLLVVQKYKQQIPLSYHLVDKKSLHGDSKEYSIL